MKKYFPWIIALLSVSLVGIIFIQYSWIKNAVDLRKSEYDQRILVALGEIRKEIVNNDHSSVKDMDRSNIRSQPWQSFFQSFSQATIFPVRLRYSNEELQAIIKNNLKKQGFQTSFEYAVLNIYPFNTAEYELFSSNFFNVFRDSINYKQFRTPLIDEQSGFGGIVNSSMEMLDVIVPVDNYISSSLKSMKWIIGGSLLFTLIILTAFTLTIYVMLRQKKLSTIKSDFINNMTHELKTPLATISLAVDAIGNDKVIGNKEKTHYFSNIIKTENKRMLNQIETILRSALSEGETIRLNLKQIDLHELIHQAIHNMELRVKEKGGEFQVNLRSDHFKRMVDEVHFSNLITNLLDNAIKYSKESPLIKIETFDRKKTFVLVISDNGIGMNKETVSRIFEKFYRAPTGNLHNVKGFGLGLSYVKAVVDAHKGQIKVSSSLGKGSKFEIELPDA